MDYYLLKIVVLKLTLNVFLISVYIYIYAETAVPSTSLFSV